MSGGHWDYEGFRLQQGLLTVGQAQELWPLTTQAFVALANPLFDAEHEMDWAMSGDTNPSEVDDTAMFKALLEALMKIAPDSWFPRGKWATIQAVQDRVV